MGEYYRAAEITLDGRVLVLRPDDFSGFRKLMEHLWIGDCACDEHDRRGKAHALSAPFSVSGLAYFQNLSIKFKLGGQGGDKKA
jgi:hypothetical protein